MALFSIMGSLLASCGDIELNPGPGLSECVPVYTHCCYITPDIHHDVCCVSSKSSLGAWYLSHLLDTSL